MIGTGDYGGNRIKRTFLHIFNCCLFSFSFPLYFCSTNESAAAAVAAAAMLGATGGQAQPMSAVNLGALAGGAGGPQMMATPFGMLGTAPRFG